MRIQVDASFETKEDKERFATIMEYGNFKVRTDGLDVHCVFDGYVPDCLLRQLPLAVKHEYEARNKAVLRRCLEVSGVLE